MPADGLHHPGLAMRLQHDDDEVGVPFGGRRNEVALRRMGRVRATALEP